MVSGTTNCYPDEVGKLNSIKLLRGSAGWPQRATTTIGRDASGPYESDVSYEPGASYACTVSKRLRILTSGVHGAHPGEEASGGPSPKRQVVATQ